MSLHSGGLIWCNGGSISPPFGVFGAMAAQLTNYTSGREKEIGDPCSFLTAAACSHLWFTELLHFWEFDSATQTARNLQMEPFLCIEVLCAWPAGFFWFPRPAQTLPQAGPNTGNRQTHIWLQAAAPLQEIPRPRHCGMPGPAPETVKATYGCQPLPVYRERPLARTMWQHQKQANPQMAASPGPSTGSHLWPRHCGGNTRSGQAHMWLQAARDPRMWWAAREFPKQIPHSNASRANYTHKGKKTCS